MSSSDYDDSEYDYDTNHRGQAFLRELGAAFDALPAKRLIAGDLKLGNEVCAIGAVCQARGLDTSKFDPNDYNNYEYNLAQALDVSAFMIEEIIRENDLYRHEDPEDRYIRMRRWVASCIVE